MNKLHILAISDNGFIFNPETGESYIANETGLYILNKLKKDFTIEEIKKSLTKEYEVSELEAERDIIDFTDSVKGMRLYK